MKRKILFIGNTGSKIKTLTSEPWLPGVKPDFDNYHRFFTGLYGGCWLEREIIPLFNPKKDVLLKIFDCLEKCSLDYLVVVFSGHGGSIRDKTLLRINELNETIPESRLNRICKKQLQIFDCCRGSLLPTLTNEAKRSMAFSTKTASRRTLGIRAIIRQEYNLRIFQAKNQICKLYACSIDESAHDSSAGGLYSSELLYAANSLVKRMPGHAITANIAHLHAYLYGKVRQRQRPEISSTVDDIGEGLVFAMHPKLAWDTYIMRKRLREWKNKYLHF